MPDKGILEVIRAVLFPLHIDVILEGGSNFFNADAEECSKIFLHFFHHVLQVLIEEAHKFEVGFVGGFDCGEDLPPRLPVVRDYLGHLAVVDQVLDLAEEGKQAFLGQQVRTPFAVLDLHPMITEVH
jgi:hypothetical protein